MKLYLIKYEDTSLRTYDWTGSAHLSSNQNKCDITGQQDPFLDPILIHRSTLNTSSFSDQQLDFFPTCPK